MREMSEGVSHIQPAALKAGVAPGKRGLNGDGVPQRVEVPGGAGEGHALLACCYGLLPALLPLQSIDICVHSCFPDFLNGSEE